MRKKLLFVFYIVSAMIVCVHLGLRVNYLTQLEASNTPLFVATYSDNATGPQARVKDSINYKEWAEKYEDQTK